MLAEEVKVENGSLRVWVGEVVAEEEWIHQRGQLMFQQNPPVINPKYINVVGQSINSTQYV